MRLPRSLTRRPDQEVRRQRPRRHEHTRTHRGSRRAHQWNIVARSRLRVVSSPLQVERTPDPVCPDRAGAGRRPSRALALPRPAEEAPAPAHRHSGQAPAGASESLWVSWRGPRDASILRLHPERSSTFPRGRCGSVLLLAIDYLRGRCATPIDRAGARAQFCVVRAGTPRAALR